MMKPALLLPLLLLATAARADRIAMPSAGERGGQIEARIIAEPPLNAPATITADWTDALGRHVGHYTITAQPGAPIALRLDLGRAVAMDNTLRIASTRDGVRHEATARFVARPAPDAWNDFQVITYAEQAAGRHAAMRALGVTAVKVFGHRVDFTAADVGPRIAAPLAGDFRWYVENIATDFYSPYHMWTPEHGNDVTWRFTQAQARHQANPADPQVFERSPSLSDPAWIARIGARLADHARAHGDFRPLYYSLGDEPGIADLSAAWDFDRSPPALADFRAWLRVRHGDLAALNAAWGSDFAAWEAVLPETTTGAMARTDGNYTAWNDHKQFMDETFAAALRSGTAALHRADPTALAAIEGGQIPGWGGWNYATLAGAAEVMEIYDTGQNLDIAGALDPAMIPLATSFERNSADRRRLWRGVLRGVRGVILWDDADDILGEGGTLGPAGKALAPLFAELQSGLATLLIASPPVRDDVAVLYSPISFRLQWLRDHRAAGDAWTRRSSELEGQDNAVRVAMREAAGQLQAAGIVPHWLTPDRLAAGGLRHGVRLLVLPQLLALSDGEASEIAAFRAAGGTVVALGETGLFDGMGRTRPAPLDLPHGEVTAALAAAGITPLARMPTARGGEPPPTVTVRRNGDVLLLGIASGRDAPLESQDTPRIAFDTRHFMRDLRHGGGWNEASSVEISLDREGPVLLALAPVALPAPLLRAPTGLRAGETARLTLGLAGPTPAAATVLHVTLRDPAGRIARVYSGNTVLRGGEAIWPVPFACDDQPGDWRIEVHDVLGGGTVEGVISLALP